MPSDALEYRPSFFATCVRPNVVDPRANPDDGIEMHEFGENRECTIKRRIVKDRSHLVADQAAYTRAELRADCQGGRYAVRLRDEIRPLDTKMIQQRKYVAALSVESDVLHITVGSSGAPPVEQDAKPDIAESSPELLRVLRFVLKALIP